VDAEQDTAEDTGRFGVTGTRAIGCTGERVTERLPKFDGTLTIVGSQHDPWFEQSPLCEPPHEDSWVSEVVAAIL
jgi:hypothetical protein